MGHHGNSFLSFPAVVGEVGGWVELARTSNAALPDVTSIPDKRYYMILNFQESNNSNPGVGMRLNADSGDNYSNRRSASGATDITTVSQSEFDFMNNTAGVNATIPYFMCGYFANLLPEEKLVQSWGVNSRGGTGSGIAPGRMEFTGKWTNTIDAIDQMTIINPAGGSFNANGELVVLGWDPTDTHTDNFWEELASVTLVSSADEISTGTFTAKKYLWYQVFYKNTGVINTGMTFNNDTSGNYSQRSSFDGAADSTSVGQNKIDYLSIGGFAQNGFENGFIINNSANEKLVLGHLVRDGGSGAGNDPSRVEGVAKWDNTSAQITEIDFVNTDTGSFDTGTTLKVWGSN